MGESFVVSRLPWRLFRLCFSIVFEDFCDLTSFHGVRYLSAKHGGSNLKRALWLVLLLVLWVTVGVFTYYLFQRHMGAVTQTKIKSAFHPSAGSVFPAVTVCPPNRIDKVKLDLLLQDLVESFEKSGKPLMEFDIQNWRMTLLEFTAHRTISNQSVLEQLTEVLEFRDISYLSLIEDVITPCNESLIECSWESKIKGCSDFFRTILTSEGPCCTFNYQGAQFLTDTPKGALMFGLYSGLSFKVLFDTNCSTKTRLYVHDPETFPSEIIPSTIIAHNQQFIGPVAVIRSYSDENLRKLSPKVRECIFPDEYRLKFFSKYTFENCITECRINMFLKSCGCIPHAFGDINTSDTSVCDLNAFKCVSENYANVLQAIDADSASSACSCDKLCDISIFEYKPTLVEMETSSELPTDVSVVRIFYSKSHFTLQNKFLRYHGLHFMSSVGGLLSLFLGCSFMSILEIFYFFGFRLIKNYRQIRADMNVLYVTPKYLEYSAKNAK